MPVSDPTGENYNGKVRKSGSGKRCQRWGEDRPFNFRKFCRKIDGKDKPGCFVKTGGQKTFQYCNIPFCPVHSETCLNPAENENSVECSKLGVKQFMLCNENCIELICYK